MLITFQNVVFAFFRDRRFLTVHYFFENENEKPYAGFLFYFDWIPEYNPGKKRITVQVGSARVSGTPGRGKPVSGTLGRGSQAAPGGAPSRGSSGKYHPRVRLISGKKRLSMYHPLRYMKRMSACGILERNELYTIHHRRCLHCNAGLQHQ